jgi:hypothetical protein
MQVSAGLLFFSPVSVKIKGTSGGHYFPKGHNGTYAEAWHVCFRSLADSVQAMNLAG